MLASPTLQGPGNLSNRPPWLLVALFAIEDGGHSIHQECSGFGKLHAWALVKMHLGRAKFLTQINRADGIGQTQDSAFFFVRNHQFKAALLTTVLRREKCPEKKTLFILDECAQLGTMPLLEQAVTLLRGYGLQVWTFWQDMEQVRSNYPSRHETLINNAAVLQAFGISNSMMARQLTEVLDCSSADLLTMKNEESRVFMKGQGSRTCRLPDYLHDAAFKGLWDNNPFFGGPSASGRPNP